MSNHQIERLKSLLKAIKETVDEKTAVNLELDKWENMIERLHSFSADCDECTEHMNVVEDYLTQLKDKVNDSEEVDNKQHKLQFHNISTHLTKQHHVITSGYYLSIYMSIGTGIGLVFGMLLFDNMILGLVFGSAIGVAIGSSLDADAKKKGQVL